MQIPPAEKVREISGIFCSALHKPISGIEKEYRNTVPFAVVGEEEKELVLRGSPIIFNRETVLFEYDGIEYKEIIDSKRPGDSFLLMIKYPEVTRMVAIQIPNTEG